MLLDKEKALALLRKSRQSENAYGLFEEASKLRSKYLGDEIWFSSAGSSVFACNIVPKCSYCCYYRGDEITEDDLLRGIEAIEKLGLEHFHISGGTDLKEGYDERIIKLIERIKKHSNMQIEINLGPSFKDSSVRELKKLGICSITSSLECINPKVFEKAKPGDNLQRRKALLELCNDEKIQTRTVMLLGIGESDEDIIAHLFYLQKLSSLYHLTISRFRNFPDTKYAKHYPCSAWEVAVVSAIARLLMPKIEISIPQGNNEYDLPLWSLAGGGNQILATMMLSLIHI